MTKQQATEIARQFVADYVRADRQWDVRTLENYLPRGMQFRVGADYSGPATVASIASFVRSEAR